LRLVCLLVRTALDRDAVSRQVRATLYGMRSLLGASATGTSAHYECLYFSESSFFRHRAVLDAAIIIEGDDVFACVNDHSKRRRLIAESALGRFFASRKVLYDAREWEQTGLLVADCAIDRMREAEVQAFVESKYQLGRTT